MDLSVLFNKLRLVGILIHTSYTGGWLHQLYVPFSSGRSISHTKNTLHASRSSGAYGYIW